MRLLRIDAGARTWRYEEPGDDRRLTGGRALIGDILLAEVPPTCDALGDSNKLVIAGGALAGTGVSSAGRLSIGCKSPLTGGIKEANAGGTAAAALARLGLRGLVIEGAAAPDWTVLLVTPDGLRFEDGTAYAGLGNFDLVKRLLGEYRRDYSVISIGQAGEIGLHAATVAVTDMFGRPSRMAARGGVGAVMGSKRVKAILVANGGKQAPSAVDPTAFSEARKRFNQAVLENDRSKNLAKYGTAVTLRGVNVLGGLPTRNFSGGAFEEAETLTGEHMYEVITSRGGEGTPTETCMHGCVIRCSNCYPDESGRELVAPLEYETIALMGSNLGLASLDDVARLNYACNDFGLDTIEVGATLGVMADGGLARFGDAASFLEILDEVPSGSLLGRLAGMGAGVAGTVLGVRRVPVVKNQAIPGYDPRAIKGTGVTYCTCPMGADHTAGLTLAAKVDHHKPNGQVALSRGIQLVRASYDSLGLCIFLMGATGSQPALVLDLLRTFHGAALPDNFLTRWGGEIISAEVTFNRRAGIGPQADRLPEFFSRENLPPYGVVFDVPEGELSATWESLPERL
ncbi:MAG: aldehyde ferredoxin oxidoreductase [Firmicutes bacterium]|nr:aldehyde ferredoxin oxidoreductase [Bacillota bacterium]